MADNATPHETPAATGIASDTVLALRDVRFGYVESCEVIRGISATLAAGELCCLIGPNAAGKSTLMRLMLGQLQPWSGQVTLMGEEVFALPHRRRAQLVSYVPQKGGVHFAFTVRQVVAMGVYARGNGQGGEQAVELALAQCELQPLAGRVFAELSGGQQQRVLIARALAQIEGRGRVMLLDEPANSLDLRHMHELMRLLVEQTRQGLAVLVVLHDLNLAARYAQQVWLMDGGELKAAGPWREVLQSSVLEPVYGVKLDAIHDGATGRAMFRVD